MAAAALRLTNSAEPLRSAPKPRRFSQQQQHGAQIFACLCTACNAIKFLTPRGCATGAVKNSDPRRSSRLRPILVAGEGICFSAAIATQAACLLQPPQQRQIQEQNTAAAAPCVARWTSVPLPAWQMIPLWLALLFSMALRRLEQRVENAPRVVEDVARMGKIEEDVASSVAIVRGLSRQVEKLGVRVQATRRTIQDPMQQTAALAESVCEAVKAVSIREAALEREVEATQKALVAMQEQQAKQVELIAELVRMWRKMEVSRTPDKINNHRVINDDYKYDYWLTSNPKH